MHGILYRLFSVKQEYQEILLFSINCTNVTCFLHVCMVKINISSVLWKHHENTDEDPSHRIKSSNKLTWSFHDTNLICTQVHHKKTGPMRTLGTVAESWKWEGG